MWSPRHLASDHTVDLLQFLHEIGLCLEAPRRIHDDKLRSACLCRLKRIKDNGGGIRSFAVFNDLDIRSLAPDLKLLDGGCAKRIRRRQQNTFALVAVVGTQLPNGRRLADAICPNHQDHRWRAIRHGRITLSAIQDADNFFFQKRNQVIRRLNVLISDPLSYRRDQHLRRLDANIGHQKGFFQLIDEIVINVSIANNQAFNAMGKILPCLR